MWIHADLSDWWWRWWWCMPLQCRLSNQTQFYKVHVFLLCDHKGLMRISATDRVQMSNRIIIREIWHIVYIQYIQRKQCSRAFHCCLFIRKRRFINCCHCTIWSLSLSGQAGMALALLSANSLCWTRCRYEEKAIRACTLLKGEDKGRRGRKTIKNCKWKVQQQLMVKRYPLSPLFVQSKLTARAIMSWNQWYIWYYKENKQ